MNAPFGMNALNLMVAIALVIVAIQYLPSVQNIVGGTAV